MRLKLIESIISKKILTLYKFFYFLMFCFFVRTNHFKHHYFHDFFLFFFRVKFFISIEKIMSDYHFIVLNFVFSNKLYADESTKSVRMSKHQFQQRRISFFFVKLYQLNFDCNICTTHLRKLYFNIFSQQSFVSFVLYFNEFSLIQSFRANFFSDAHFETFSAKQFSQRCVF